MKLHLDRHAVAILANALSGRTAARTLTSFSDQFNRAESLEHQKLDPERHVATWCNGWPFACTFASRNAALYDDGNGIAS